MHRIPGVGGAVLETLIGNVYGVFPFLGDVGTPENAGGVLFVTGHGIGHPGRSHGEGILPLMVDFLGIGKSHTGVGPLAFLAVSALAAHAFFPRSIEGFVVVAHHLVHLRVAFPGAQDYRAGILQHGHQEGNHVALREDVLDGAVVGGALPFPAVVLGLPIIAVALPQCYMAAAQAQGPEIVSTHQGWCFVPQVRGPEFRSYGFAAGAGSGHFQILDGLFSGI